MWEVLAKAYGPGTIGDETDDETDDRTDDGI